MTFATSFDQPVELRCITDPAGAMRRVIPALVVMGFAVWLLAALALGLTFPHDGTPVMLGAVVVAVAVTGAFYVRQRERLRVTYRDRQRLMLHPGGLRRSDGTIEIDMPWAGITGFDYRNSALPPARSGFVHPTNPLRGPAAAALTRAHTVMGWGVVGAGVVTPLPTAVPAQLRVHDRLGGSRLAEGQPQQSPRCLIFPAEFESGWQRGVVGAWLRHHRPDLPIPDDAPPRG